MMKMDKEDVRSLAWLVVLVFFFALAGCASRMKVPAPEAPVNAGTTVPQSGTTVELEKGRPAHEGGGFTLNFNFFGYGDWPVPGAVYLPYGGRWPRWVEGRWYLGCPWGPRGPCRHIWEPGHYE